MEYQNIALVPLIVGLVEVLKRLVPEKYHKYAPIAAIGFGLIAGMVYVSPESIKDGAIIGVMLGLSASGLYSGAKSIKG